MKNDIGVLAQVLNPARHASWAERLVLNQLAQLDGGELELSFGGQTRNLGRPSADGLRARVTVLNGALFTKAILGGTLGCAESYMDGDWVTDDLTRTMRLFVRDPALMSGFESGASRIGQSLARWYHAHRPNTREGSRRNIAKHYDLGNDFFAKMLDPTMTYSAGVFPSEHASMTDASVNKLDLLCRRLGLGPNHHLLEIGTGWGSMAIHAASHYGCRVTTTTISKSQRDWARRVISERGLDQQITVLESDYRDLTGQYDRIVSCEMIEAIGADQYPGFFAKCSSLLAPEGRLALQAITIRDQIYAQAREEVDFIKRYIFPGSCIPSVTALLEAATSSSDFVLREFEDYTSHYARTMRAWREQLAPHKASVVATYGERFWRMWSFYLAYCEAGFEENHIGSAHLLFERSK